MSGIEPVSAASTWNTLSPYLRRFRSRFVLVSLLIIAVVCVDLIQPWLVKIAIDRYLAVPVPDEDAVLLIAGGYLGVVLLSFLLAYFQEILLQDAGQSIVREIRIDLFRHIQTLALRYFDQNSAGRIITNVVSDTEALNNLFTQFLSQTLRGLLSLVLIMGCMIRLDLKVALYCFLLIPLIAAIAVFFQQRMRAINAEVRSRLGSAIGFLAENLRGMAIIQIFHQEAKQQRRFDDQNRLLVQATIKENCYFLLFFNVTELLGDLGIAALLWFGGQSVLAGSISFGVLYAFVSYIRRFFQPINTLSQQMNTLQASLVATERIAATLREEPDIREADDAVSPAITGEVVFEQAFLAYRPDLTVLNGISLSIRPGERVGFVGATGAGKTSLMNLVTRFYDTTGGRVLIDGIDVRRWSLDSLRSGIGIVQQDVTLFSGSVTDNIRFFREDIPEERVRQACRLVGAEPFIFRLSAGYDTQLSERAATLSAGERQLLSFARVLVFDPRILILDEATASLDSRTEEILQQAIHRVAAGRTLLVIAHRLATIQEMDRIVVLEQGTIVETGRHDELLARQGQYWQLHQAGLLLDEAA